MFPVDGGKVHYVLGNHETMVMAGDNRYVRRKYLELADALNMNLTHDIFGMAGEFGRWMRTKNIMVKIGDILFVHGGISIDFLERKLSVGTVNKIARRYYGSKRTMVRESGEASKIFGEEGPLWYRGMVDNSLSGPDVDAILAYYKVEKIVFGHTILNEMKTFHRGRLIGIDVRQPNNGLEGKTKALLIKNGRLYEVGGAGARLISTI